MMFSPSPHRIMLLGLQVAALLLLLATAKVTAAASSSSSSYSSASSLSIPDKIWRRGRRILNFSSVLGTPTRSDTPYDRIAGHPVFSITTPWGSPYMSMEKLSDAEDFADAGGASSKQQAAQSISEEQNEYRTVCLYFMDPDDALQLHGEMGQMENMGQADLRVTSFSMSKALRQAANVLGGHGLVTGAPIDASDGRLPIEEGGALRYKIVPPKRQLYYAARCVGRERVGLFDTKADGAAEDAQTALLGNIDGQNLIRRREKMERKGGGPARTPLQQQYAHMEGYTGIPVFYAPEMRRVLPWLKRLTCANKVETPMFFDYEDLQVAWNQMQERQNKGKKNAVVPLKPSSVEVFNLWDVLTSMDREAYKQRQETSFLKRHVVRPLWSRLTAFSPGKASMDHDGPGLEHITFVPSSRSVQYKQGISARGNGKARLKPMR